MLGARWIRLGPVELLDLRAACLGLAEARDAAARPIVLWGRAKNSVCLGPRAAYESDDEQDALVWVDAPNFVFAVLAPVRVAPGRCARWTSWALAPALATYRQFGVHAYLEGSAIWLHGRCLADSSTLSIADSIIVASSFPDRCGSTASAPSEGERPSFRAWLRGGAALSRSEWADPHETPAERELEAALRARIEAQHDWKFEHSWPDAWESAAIERARATLEPLAVL